MREFVSDHVEREGFGTVGQLTPQDDATTATANRTGAGHPQRPAFAGNKVFQRDAEPRIVQKVALHDFRQAAQHSENTHTQWLTIGECFEMGREDLVVLVG